MSKITVTAFVTTPGQTAWSYYTLPEHITNWNFASDDWQCPHASNDLRSGGVYSTRMEAKDGSFGFDFEGTYTVVELNKTMTYVLADVREVTTSFEEENDITIVTTVFDAETENPIAMQQAGWQAILDNYKSYCDKNNL
jgi:uncharacterized protein YndB with AHSA1/START domain